MTVEDKIKNAQALSNMTIKRLHQPKIDPDKIRVEWTN